MAVSIRLRRLGSNQKPYFRVVAAQSQRATQGKFQEMLGVYDPLSKGAKVRVDVGRIQELQRLGASLSPSVARLLKQAADTGKTA